MRVLPGNHIPFWLRLWDGAGDRYVRARITDKDGMEQSGSPYPLAYSGARGIYTAMGPMMASQILVVDYEVFTDSGFTEIDGNYLPEVEWVEPDISAGAGSSGIIVLRAPVKGVVSATKLTGTVKPIPETSGEVKQPKISGTVTAATLTGTVIVPDIEETL